MQIKIESAVVQQAQARLRQQSGAMRTVAVNVSSVLNGLDMQIAATQQIRQSLEALSRRCTTEQTQLEAMTQMLLAASDRFTQTDQKLGRQAKGLNNLADDMQSAVSGMAATAVGLKGIDQNLKVSELNQAFGISQNNTTQDGVTLAKKEKSGKNVFEYSIPNDGKNGTEVDIKALGYEAGDGEYEAYLAKITGKDAFMIGGAVAVGTVAGVTIGSAHAGAGFSADLFESSKKASAKEGMKTGASLSSGDTFYEEMDGSVTGDDKFDLFNVGVKAEAGATVARFDYNTTIGTEKYNGYVDANVKLLDANAGAAFGAKYGSDGLSVLGKAEVGASLAEVEGTVGGTVAGVKAEATVSAEIGVGASFEVGYDDGEFKFTLGAALGVGGKISFKIKLPKLW